MNLLCMHRAYRLMSTAETLLQIFNDLFKAEELRITGAFWSSSLITASS